MNATSDDALRYRYLGCERYPGGGDFQIVFSRLTGRARLVSTRAARLLAECDRFDTLENHAALLATRHRATERQQTVIAGVLAEAAAGGLLASEHDLAARTPQAPERADMPISCLAIPTRHNPALLRRALESYMGAHFESRRVLVVDDSTDAEQMRQNAEVLSGVAASHAVSATHLDLTARRELMEALIARGIDREAVEFALENPERCPISTGAARNALLLATQGEAMLSVDDDTIHMVAKPPVCRAETALSSKHDPTEFWFPEHTDANWADAEWTSENAFHVHEGLLGKTPFSAVDLTRVDLNDLRPGFLDRVLQPESRIRVTSMGLIGDAAMPSAVGYLALDGDSHRRLVRSEPAYRIALRNREILRAVTRPTITEGYFCMGMNAGLDNRDPLPPFFPVQRNQDALFALLVRNCLPGSFFGYLPRALFHRPSGNRAYSPVDPTEVVLGTGSSDVINALISSFDFASAGTTAEKRMIGLGSHLKRLGQLPLADFTEVVRVNWLGRVGSMIAALDRRAQDPAAPAYWKRDLEKLIATTRASVVASPHLVPFDLAAGRSLDETRQFLQRLIFRFGATLENWPSMAQVAASLGRAGWFGRFEKASNRSASHPLITPVAHQSEIGLQKSASATY